VSSGNLQLELLHQELKARVFAQLGSLFRRFQAVGDDLTLEFLGRAL
jgi:hypothetical protein